MEQTFNLGSHGLLAVAHDDTSTVGDARIRVKLFKVQNLVVNLDTRIDCHLRLSGKAACSELVVLRLWVAHADHLADPELEIFSLLQNVEETILSKS